MIEIKWNQMSPREISNSIQVSLQKDEARDISKLFQTFVTGFLGVGGWGIKWHCASNFHKRWCHFGQRTRSTEPLNFVPVAQMIIVINVLRSYLLDARNKNFTAWARWTLAATLVECHTSTKIAFVAEETAQPALDVITTPTNRYTKIKQSLDRENKNQQLDRSSEPQTKVYREAPSFWIS